MSAKKDGARAAKPGRRAASKTRGDDAGAPLTSAKKTVARRSGANIPNAQRHTVALLIRVRPEIAAWLRDRAAAWGCTMGEVLEAARPALETNIVAAAEALSTPPAAADPSR